MTATYSSPTKYPSGAMSYEMAMGVPPAQAAPMFHFRKRFGDINWRKLGVIDIDKIARELDFVTLQENISMVAFCNIDAVSDLDPLFAKIFKMSQFTIEYLLHSQEYLQSVISGLETRVESDELEAAAVQVKTQEIQNEVQKLKAENKKRRKMIEQQQMLIESGASSYYKCPHCEKAFMNASFLQGHMQRKHPDSVNYIGDVIAHSQREQSLLAGRLTDLDKNLQQERINFTEKLRKAEEEKAAWGARTRRDMQRWKKEEEGKWRRELESMKQTFVDEIQKLKAQEAEYKKKILSLEHTMGESHSNLGDLQDDMEGEKQRLQVYEERIKMLERTNAEKQSQLQQLADEMNNLRDQNKQALLKHQRSMTDNYDSQLQRIKEKVDKHHERKEIEPIAAAEAGSPPESTEEVDGDDDIAAMRRDRANIAAQMRPLLVQMMESHLQNCGVDPRAPGITSQTLMNKLMVLKTERQKKARDNPEYYSIRDRLRRKVDGEMNARNQGSPPRKKRGRSQPLPRQRQQSPAPIGRTNSMERMSAPPPQSRISAPAGRIGHAPSPVRRADKTMTRDELNTRYQDEEDDDSAWDSDLTEVDSPPVKKETKPKEVATPIKQQHLTPKPVTRTPTTARDSWDSDDLEDLLSPETEIHTATPKVEPRVTSSSPKFKVEAQLVEKSSGNENSLDDSLDRGSEESSNIYSMEIDEKQDQVKVTGKWTSGQVQPETSSVNSWDDEIESFEFDDVEYNGGTKIQQLGAAIESQLQARGSDKPPVGGVDISGPKAQTSTTRIKHIDSEDEDFSLVSSLNESPKPAPRSAQAPTSKVRQSTTSNSTNTLGTSVWGSNQGKPGAGGKNETAEQESDWDDISDL